MVTGSKTFKYLKVEENSRSFGEIHSQLDTQGEVVSDEYTCHTWAKDSV
mgnify:CR=1 FL=1